MKTIDNLYRNTVFFCGHLHKIRSFPWITWDENEQEFDFDGIQEALPLIREGDIGIHREIGYLANVFIPGCFKHAWIHTDSPTGSHIYPCTAKMSIIEAISAGVLKRSAIYPFRDYIMILRPRVNRDDVELAMRKANKIVGCEYDYNFKFDIEEELGVFSKDITKDREFLRQVKNNLSSGHNKFCCTEVCAYAYWHVHKQLEIERHERRGKKVILADDFINKHFDIIWVSPITTPENAKKLGLHQFGIDALKRYWETTTQVRSISKRINRIR